MMGPLRLGIVGAGTTCRVAHLPAPLDYGPEVAG